MGFTGKPLRKIGVYGLIALAIFLTFFFNALYNYELITYDLRFKLRPRQSTAPNLAIIEISDDTLNNLGKWPLPRDFHASLVAVLKELGAKKIIFDILFSEPALYDAELSKNIKASGNVYLPLAFYLAERPARCKDFYFSSGSLLADLTEILKESCAGSGHINMLVDADGKTRSIPLFIRYKEKLIAQLALLAAADELGLDAQRVEISGRRLIIDGRLSLPLSEAGAFLVNYPAGWGEDFAHFSYFEILKSYGQKQRGEKPDIDLSLLKDKICFIGLTATGTSDLRPTPLDRLYPVLGLQASVFNSIIRSEFIREAGLGLNFILGLLVFILSFFFCRKFSPVKSFFTTAGLGIAYALGAIFLFIWAGIWIRLFLPLSIIILVYISVTFWRFFSEVKKRALLEKELEIAQSIQKSFLPQGETSFGGLDISSFIRPAKFVAGDLFDFVEIDDARLGVFIGDVSGKGVPASLIMAQTISFFRIFARQSCDCAKTLDLINKELAGRMAARFVTCMYIIIDTAQNTASVSSAGHSPLLLYRKKTGQLSEIELNAGLPLGIAEDAVYDNVPFNIEKGDKIIIFTDGLTEARNASGEEFGSARIKKVLSENCGKKAAALSASVMDALAKFSFRCAQHDDITLIILGR